MKDSAEGEIARPPGDYGLGLPGLSRVIPGRTLIKFSESFVKIAAIAVTEHSGDFLHRKIGPFQQEYGTLHPLFQKNLGKGFSEILLEQQSGNVVWMVRKMFGYIFKGHNVRVLSHIMDDLI